MHITGERRQREHDGADRPERGPAKLGSRSASTPLPRERCAVGRPPRGRSYRCHPRHRGPADLATRPPISRWPTASCWPPAPAAATSPTPCKPATSTPRRWPSPGPGSPSNRHVGPDADRRRTLCWPWTVAPRPSPRSRGPCPWPAIAGCDRRHHPRADPQPRQNLCDAAHHAPRRPLRPRAARRLARG